MINTNFYDVAATYLNRVPNVQKANPSTKIRKVEATSAVYTGKRFNANAGIKANFASHIDICI